jgi:hypothetical protein
MRTDPVLWPAPSLQELAKRFWGEMVNSQGLERALFAEQLRGGWWWAVWEDDKLRVKRQHTQLAGTASGGKGGSLGEPIVEYDGAAITAKGLGDDDSIVGETLDMMVNLAKLLKERSDQSGWASVAIAGDPEIEQKLKQRLRADWSAPDVFDPLVRLSRRQ